MEKEINEGLETALDYLQDEVIPSLKRQNKELQQRIDKALEKLDDTRMIFKEELISILRGDE